MHEQAKTERIRLRVTPSVLKRARKWAERRGLSLSAYVRRAMTRQMDEDLMDDIQSKTQSTTNGRD